MMKIRYIQSLLFLLTGISFLLTGCHRRELDYGYYEGIPVQVNIDWSGTLYKAEHLRLILYPETGDNILSYYIDPSGETIHVPYGNYRALLYNWRSNADIQIDRFKGENEWKEMKAYTDFIPGSVFAENVLEQPDDLVCWSSGNEVRSFTKESLYYDGTQIVLNTRPVSLICTYDFFIPATGIQYIKSAEAVISGIIRDKAMFEDEPGTAQALMSVWVTPAKGGIGFRFSAFGIARGASHLLSVRFRLTDDTDFYFTQDLTDAIHPCEVREFKATITIPAVSTPQGGFQEPDIGGWNDIHDDIDF